MEAFGRFASGIARDFNDLLSVIIGYADLAAEKSLSTDGMSPGRIEGVGKAGRSATDLTNQILSFSPSSFHSPGSFCGKETLLVVEDTNSLRKLLRDILEHSGYTVLDAASGQEGLAAAARHRGEIHLILSDVIMPEMSGSDFGRAMQRVLPSSKVVFMSGYPGSVVAGYDVDLTVPPVLQKPFTREALLQSVRCALDGTLDASRVYD